MVKRPVLESKEVDVTPATVTVPAESTCPCALILSDGISDAVPYVPAVTFVFVNLISPVPEVYVTPVPPLNIPRTFAESMSIVLLADISPPPVKPLPAITDIAL